MGKNKKKDSLTWGQLFGFYRKIKVPWWAIALSLIISLAVKKVALLVVPYQTKLMTGAITDHGFLAGFLIFTAINTLMESINEMAIDLSGNLMARNVRHAVWGRMLKLPMPFFKGKSQSMVSRVTKDTTGMYAGISAVVQLVSVIYGVYIAFKQMYITYKSLALVMVALLPVTLLTAWILGKLQYKIIEITNSSMAEITDFFAERLPNLNYIKTSNMEDEEYKKGIEASRRRYQAEVKQENLFILTAPIMMISQYINQIVLLLIATSLVRAGAMKMFQMVNLYNYFLNFMSNALMIGGLWQALMGAKSSGSVIARIIHAQPEDLEGGMSLEKENQDIIFDHVSFSYDGEREILSDVSFTIPRGKVTAIVGENGCGKSTILKLLERFEEPIGGNICLGDAPLKDVNLKEWRDAVGYLFQGDQIIKGSIKENISYGLSEHTDEEIRQAAEKACAWEFIESRKHKMDSKISKFDAKCSGGEQQRIAIARNILKEPDYLFMDEATSGIDTVTEKIILKNIFDQMRGKTVVMITHDLELMKKAEHLIVLANGQIEAQGSFEKIKTISPTLEHFISVEKTPTSVSGK